MNKAFLVKYSIIIPVYNVSLYLRECLDSIFAAVKSLHKKGISDKQDNTLHVEIICIDDGSTDDSGGILDEYQKLEVNPKIHVVVVHQQNAGVSAARNAALEIAAGQWILFVDADDVVRDSWLVNIDTCIETRQLKNGLIAFDKTEFNESIAWPEKRGIQHIDIRFQIHALMGHLALYQFVYPHGLVQHIRFMPYTVGEDLLFVASVLAKADVIEYVEQPLYAYRQRQGSAMHSSVSIRKIQDILHYIPQMLDVLEQSGKRLDRIFWHTRANRWLEGVPSLIYDMPDRNTKQLLMNEWRQSLKEVKKLRCLSCFNRIRGMMNLVLPFDVVGWVTCVLPYKIKIWGNTWKREKNEMHFKEEM